MVQSWTPFSALGDLRAGWKKPGPLSGHHSLIHLSGKEQRERKPQKAPSFFRATISLTGQSRQQREIDWGRKILKASLWTKTLLASFDFVNISEMFRTTIQNVTHVYHSQHCHKGCYSGHKCRQFSSMVSFFFFQVNILWPQFGVNAMIMSSWVCSSPLVFISWEVVTKTIENAVRFRPCA